MKEGGVFPDPLYVGVVVVRHWSPAVDLSLVTFLCRSKEYQEDLIVWSFGLSCKLGVDLG